MYLAGFSVAEALLGNTPGFEGGAAALDQNSVEIGKTIAAAYGPEAEKRFLELWRAHIGMFVAYTQASAKNDAAGKEKAVGALIAIAPDNHHLVAGNNVQLIEILQYLIL